MVPSTVVLLGDVGVGKSTIVEKITGRTGLSSRAAESSTLSATAFSSPCGRLLVLDTPGANSMANKLEHNVCIAHALNYRPVSLIMITVRAEIRIDNTVGCIQKYAERFQDVSRLLCACVTHMDMVTWTQERFLGCMTHELGLDSAIFVGKHTVGPAIVDDILRHCRDPQEVSITAKSFRRFFEISSDNVKILKSIRDEVVAFDALSRDFLKQLKLYEGQDKVELIFCYLAFAGQAIEQIKQKVTEANSFTFTGENGMVEAGHISNLANQLNATLNHVRKIASDYQKSAGSNPRKCPHCSMVWSKLDVCGSQALCGGPKKRRQARFNRSPNFVFDVQGTNLQICRVRSPDLRPDSSHGCGMRLTWEEMVPVLDEYEAMDDDFRAAETLNSKARCTWAPFDAAAVSLKAMAAVAIIAVFWQCSQLGDSGGVSDLSQNHS